MYFSPHIDDTEKYMEGGNNIIHAGTGRHNSSHIADKSVNDDNIDALNMDSAEECEGVEKIEEELTYKVIPEEFHGELIKCNGCAR